MTRACRPLTAWRRLAALSCAAALLAVRPADADTCSGLSLGVPSDGATQADPAAVAVGDFDRNGWLDVVAANAGAGTVTVLLGNGSGGLAPQPPRRRAAARWTSSPATSIATGRSTSWSRTARGRGSS